MVPPARGSLNSVFQASAEEEHHQPSIGDFLDTLAEWEKQLKQLPPEDLLCLGDNSEEPTP